jgi:HlyD family secretion protein
MNNLTKALVLLTVLGGLVAFKVFKDQRQQTSVQLSAVQQGALTDSILASGNLVYNTQIQFRSELMGRVQQVLVTEGQQVQKGQLLMQLDPASYQAELTQIAAVVAKAQVAILTAKAELANLERQLTRQQRLLRQKMVQQETVDLLASQVVVANMNVQAAQLQLEQSQAQQQQAAENLAKTEFRAPIDGVMVSVDVKAGETVIPGTINIIGSDLMTLADTSAILAELRVDEADIHAIKLGQAATVFAAAAPETALTGKVLSIGSSARLLGSSQALSFRVKVLLDSATITLYPGMSCRAELITQTLENKMNVPVAAVQKDAQGHFVWVEKAGIAEQMRVKVGLANDTSQVISQGLTGDEQVIVGPARTLLSLKAGQKVKAEDSKP